MAGTRDVRSLMRKQLGKRVADAILNKLDRMARRGASASKIEKAFCEDLADHIAKEVCVASASKVETGLYIASKVGVLSHVRSDKP